MINKKIFSDADLSSYVLTYAHGLNTTDLIVKWYDDNGIERSTFDALTLVDANTITLDCGGSVGGDNTLLLYYEGSGSVSGKRAFELAASSSISNSDRFILGRAGLAAFNVTYSTLKSLLNNALTFLKTSQNLNDLPSKTTARSNLGVYSTSSVDTLLAAKASLLQAASGSVLGINNTSVYSPSGNYNPATLATVNNMGFKMIYAGAMTSAGVLTEIFRNTDILASALVGTKPSGSGYYNIEHNLGSTSYYVIANSILTGIAAGNYYFGGIYRLANDFSIFWADDATRNDTAFEFFMFQIPSYV